MPAHGIRKFSGTGSPEGSVAAPPASIYHRTSDNTLWDKTSGIGNTGWSSRGGLDPNALYTDGTRRMTGALKLANNIWMQSRNAANSGEINLWRVNASDRMEAGATVESLSARSVNGVVYAKAYGVLADGTTDDSTAMAAALTAAVGKVLELPSGTIAMAAFGAVDSNTTVRGQGMGVTILKRTAGYGQGVLDASNESNVLIQDLTVDGNQSVIGAAKVGGPEISIQGTDNITHRVHVKNFQELGIGCMGTRNKVLDSMVTGIGTTGGGTGIGIWYNHTASVGVVVSGCTIRNCQINGVYPGGKATIISNNYFSGNHPRINPGGGQLLCDFQTINPTVVGNTIENGGGAQTYGIEWDAVSGTVVGNTISGNYLGINVQSAMNSVITGNVVKNNSLVGIDVQAGIDEFTITNNRCYDDRGTPEQDWGIRVVAGDSDNYIIANNDLRGNVNAAGLSDNGTGTNKQVYGNLPLSTGGSLNLSTLNLEGSQNVGIFKAPTARATSVSRLVEIQSDSATAYPELRLKNNAISGPAAITLDAKTSGDALVRGIMTANASQITFGTTTAHHFLVYANNQNRMLFAAGGGVAWYNTAGNAFVATLGGDGAFTISTNNIWYKGRNAANTADVNMWRVNASDRLEAGNTIESLTARSTNKVTSAEAYGADPTGVANSSTAINAALTAAAGGICFVPPGLYLIDATITIPANTRLVGASRKSTTLRRKSTFTNGILVTFFSGYAGIEDLTLDGGFNGTTFVDLAAQYNQLIFNSQECHALRVGFIKPTEYISVGIQAAGARIRDCVFVGNNEATEGAPTRNIYGLWSGHSAAQDYIVEGCDFSNFNWSGAYCGGKGTVTHCRFRNNHLSVLAPGGGGAQVGVESNTQDIDFKFTDNRIETTAGAHSHGIEVYGGQASLIVARNVIFGQSAAGISTGSFARNVVIRDNVCYNNGTNAARGDGVGINVTADAIGVSVIGNRCFDNQGTKTQKYGVRLDASCDGDIVVINNDLRDNLTGPLQDNSTITTKQIHGNLPHSANTHIELLTISPNSGENVGFFAPPTLRATSATKMVHIQSDSQSPELRLTNSANSGASLVTVQGKQSDGTLVSGQLGANAAGVIFGTLTNHHFNILANNQTRILAAAGGGTFFYNTAGNAFVADIASTGRYKIYANNVFATVGRNAANNADINLWKINASDQLEAGTSLLIPDAANIILATTTGTKLGTSATQKLGFFNATPIVRPTGWAAMTGTATRTTFATSTITLQQLAERHKALTDDLIALGLIGS